MFHNTTARYNAYFYAETNIKELEKAIKDNHREDFSRVLPIFYPIDSAIIEQNEELLIDARAFASKAVDWHRISKWVDPSYYLIGMADYYSAEFDDAANTFKYLNVNSKKKNIRHKSLLQLMRLFTDLENFDDAAYVIDFLSKESGINNENRFILYKNLAYYYDKREDVNGKVGSLDRSLNYVKDKKEKSRLNFILAQLYQQEGLDALAYDYYLRSLKGNPPYERAFFAQLYAQQVAEINKSKDLRRVRNYFDDLYKDSKNRELRDVILYEKALFELKQDELEEAENLLKRAARETSKNPIQKGYIYEKLATLYFEEKRDFRNSKYFLDSALTFFRPTDKIFPEVKSRHQILEKYVISADIVSKNDSLLRLAELPIEQQRLVAETFILEEQERIIRSKEEKEKPTSSNIFDNLLAFGSRGSGSTFYFENPTVIQQGTLDFYRNWGRRPLQDNWRRSQQTFQTSTTTDERIPTEREDQTLEIEDESDLFADIPDVETLLMAIPDSPEEIERMKEELEKAYFELGKILYFDLKITPISIEYLESLITQYPNTIKKPEAYYLLYLAHKELDGNYSIYAERLNREFPDSPFTLSVNNPRGSSGNQDYLMSARGYAQAYDLYQKGNYPEAKSVIRNTLENYPLTRNTDKLLLLDIMVSGKTEDKERFQSRLENYIQNTEDEPLVDMAKRMLTLLTGQDPDQTGAEDENDLDDENGEQEEGETDEEEEETPESPYKDNPNQTHIFVIVMDQEQAKNSKNLLADLEIFHNSKFAGARLRTGNMNLSRENAIFIISPFSNADKGLDYKDKFLNEFQSTYIEDESKQNAFLISIENFQELNKRKNLQEYREFYNKTY